MRDLDSDYDDYCREREQSFHQDFGEWRKNRQQQNMGEKGELQLEGGMSTGGSSSGSSETGGAGNRQGGSGRGRSASKSSGGSTMSADTGSSASDTDRSSS